MRSHKKFLALAVTEQGLSAVEVGVAAGRANFLHGVELAFTAEVNLSQPARLGAAMKQALREAGIQATRCAVGLAASFLASREKVLPATDADSLRGVLNLAAEREFASGPQELAFDYCASASGPSVQVLLLAAPRRVLEQLSAMAGAAGLSITAVTSSALALAGAAKGTVGPAGRLVLCLLEGGGELSVESPEGPRSVRRLGACLGAGGDVGPLAMELRRVLATAPAGPKSNGTRELLVWNAAGIEPAALKPLGDLGLRLRMCSAVGDLGVSGVPADAAGDRRAQALAVASLAAEAPPVDFLHSRLAARKAARLGRPARWAIAAAAVALALAAYFAWDWHALQEDIVRLQAEANRRKAPTSEAKAVVENVKFAQSWYDHRPRYMDCLLAIAQAFPPEGKVYATTLVIREDMQALLTGKATDQAAVEEVFDKLKANPTLYNVKPQYTRQAGGASREVSFAVNLSLRGAP